MLREAIKALVSGLAVYLAVVMCGGGGTSSPDATAEAGDGVGLDALEDGDSVTAPEVEQYTKAGSRLRPMYTLGADGSKTVNPGVMFDTERNAPCVFGTAEDGQLRCLPPRAAYHSGDFADADCTVRVAHAGGTECASAQYALNLSPATAFEDLPQVTPGCGGGMRIRALVQEVDRTALYRNIGADGACTPFAYPDASQRVFVIGDAIPPTAFVEGTLTHD